mgnify:CR=1 FL=1
MSSEIQILRYDSTLEIMWNTLIIKAKNALFMFNRSYMDYHRERFKDHSLYSETIPSV